MLCLVLKKSKIDYKIEKIVKEYKDLKFKLEEYKGEL